MAADSTLTQQLLTVARALQAGRVGPHVLLDKLDELDARLRNAETQFAEGVDGNPEYPAEAVTGMRDSLTLYRRAEALLRAAAQQGRTDLQPGLDALQRAEETMEAAEALHTTALGRVGTPFPAINRLLLHLRLNSPARYLQGAVDSFGEFVEQSNDALTAQGQRSTPEVRQQGQALIESLYTLLDEARLLEAGDTSQAHRMETALLALSENLGKLIGSYVDGSVQNGPTPMPVLNLALRAVEGVETGAIRRDQALSLLTALQGELSQRWATMDAPWATEAFEALMASLRYTASQLQKHASTKAAVDGVRDAAYALNARMGSPGWTEDDQMLNFRDT